MNAKLLAVSTLALVAAAATVACILADPPPIVTPAPSERPKIVVDSVMPPLGAILRADPCVNSPTDCFVVPVEADPNLSVTLRAFLDLDPIGAPLQPPFYNHTDDGGVLAVGPDAATTGQRVFTFTLVNTAFDPTQCHTITVVVAYNFNPDDLSKALTPPGGDTQYWFYQPTSDCSFYDAGTPEGGTD